jgi:hypothetical protein
MEKNQIQRELVRPPRVSGIWTRSLASRTWFRTPFVDRLAYPILVRRGCGVLTRHPSVVVDEDVVASARTAGWRFA